MIKTLFLLRTLIRLGLVLACGVAVRLDADEWVTLDHCRLVQHRANDGDSFMVKARGEEYLFRLYFVDTPELENDFPERVKEQAAYFSTTVEAALEAGEDAAEFTERYLRGRDFTVYTQWEDAWGSGRSKRFYAIVVLRDESLQEALVEAGLARIYGRRAPGAWPHGSSANRFKTKLNGLEASARRARRGAWSTSR